MRIIHITIGIIFLSFAVENKSQEIPENDPFNILTILNRSPEVANLGSYGNIPIGEYSGTPTISIPIYTLKIGGIEVPISLSYNASGIKVSQEATYVGLGWNLIAGGIITYEPVGGDDRRYHAPIYSPLPSWTKWHNFFDVITGGNTLLFNYGTIDHDVPGNAYYPYYCDVISWGLMGDGEMDVFSANFINYSFKFILHPDTHIPVFLGKKNKCIIEKEGLNFIITGENGTKYYFQDYELNKDPSLASAAPNSWYLSKIVDLNGNWVDFKYEIIGHIYSTPTMTEQDIVFTCGAIGGRDRKVHMDYRIIENLYLTKIETENVLIKFIMSDEVNPRPDINGDAQKLKEILIKDKHSDKSRLHYKLSHDFFTSCYVGGDYLTDDDWNTPGSYWPSEENLTKRLKLTGLTKLNPNNPTEESEKYIFTYEERHLLPWKTSFAQDFWGYYNGRENDCNDYLPQNAEHTLIPNGKVLSFLDDFSDIYAGFKLGKGANRGMSSEYVTTGMLKLITYPTGGRTEFVFEPHTYNNEFYLSAEDHDLIDVGSSYFLLLDYNKPYPVSNTSESFNLPIETEIELHIDMGSDIHKGEEMEGAYVKIIGPDSDNSYDFYYDENGPDYQEWDEEIVLKTGDYTFVCDYPGTLEINPTQEYAPVRSTLKYKTYDPSIIDEAVPIGGGVRIRSITNYDKNNEIVSVKKYTYIRSDGVSSGRHLIPLMNYKTQACTYGEISGGLNITYGAKYLLSSNSVIPLAVSQIGTNVGYSRVEVENYSGIVTNGKEILEFTNEYPDHGPFDKYIFYYNTNGNLLHRYLLNANNDTVKVGNYHYNSTDIETEVLNMAFLDSHYGAQPDYGIGGVSERWKIMTYLNYNFWNQLHSKEIIDYKGNQKTSQYIEYLYNQNNYCVSEKRILKSDNLKLIEKFFYPSDYANGAKDFIDEMKVAHIINKPIEKLTRNHTDYYTSGKLFTYKSGTQVGLPDKVYELEASPDLQFNFYPSNYGGNFHIADEYRPVINYDEYDDHGNLLQYHKENDIDVSFIWAYNNSLPIIKAENVDYTTLEQGVLASMPSGYNTLEDLDELCEDENNWETFNNSLRDYFDETFITTYTHDPLIGVTSITDPKGLTSYYEYDDLGRLSAILDKDGNILKEYEYHYQEEE